MTNDIPVIEDKYNGKDGGEEETEGAAANVKKKRKKKKKPTSTESGESGQTVTEQGT